MKKPKQVTNTLVDLMRKLATDPGWQALKGIVQQNIDYIGAQILGDIDTDVDGEPLNLTEAEKKDLIKWRGLNKELLNLPESIIGSIEAGKSEPIDYDPYPKVWEDLSKM